MTGQVGRPGTGLHPLRGQNNVQGASDSGLIPMRSPTTSTSTTPRRAHASRRLGPRGTLDSSPGLTVVEVMDAIKAGTVRGMYIMGENPAMSDLDAQPRARVARRAGAPGRPGHLLHRDRLPRRRDPAGQRLSREDRNLYQHRPPRADGPPGDRPARRCAPRTMELRQDRPAGMGLAVARGLRSSCGVRRDALAPCRTSPASPGNGWSASTPSPIRAKQEGDPGDPVVFVELFPREGGKARLRPRRHHSRRRAPGHRLPDGAHHRPPAGALAHRQHDAARDRARRARARPGRAGPSARTWRRWVACRATPRRSSRAAARSSCSRAPTRARRAAPCSCRSATTRRRSIASPMRRSIRSRRFPSSRRLRAPPFARRHAGAADESRRRPGAGAGCGAARGRLSHQRRLRSGQETSDFHRWKQALQEWAVSQPTPPGRAPCKHNPPDPRGPRQRLPKSSVAPTTRPSASWASSGYWDSLNHPNQSSKTLRPAKRLVAALHRAAHKKETAASLRTAEFLGRSSIESLSRGAPPEAGPGRRPLTRRP